MAEGFILTSLSLLVVDPIKKRKQELRDERFSEFAPPSIYSSSKSPSLDITSLPKRPKDDTQGDLSHALQSGVPSASGPSPPGTSQTTATSSMSSAGIPAPPYHVGGYFYPPGPYPPPFAVPPPPPLPMGMPYPPPPPPGAPYFAMPPPPGMSSSVSYLSQNALPTTSHSVPLMNPPPPPPPGLPPDLN